MCYEMSFNGYTGIGISERRALADAKVRYAVSRGDPSVFKDRAEHYLAWHPIDCVFSTSEFTLIKDVIEHSVSYGDKSFAFPYDAWTLCTCLYNLLSWRVTYVDLMVTYKLAIEEFFHIDPTVLIDRVEAVSIEPAVHKGRHVFTDNSDVYHGDACTGNYLVVHNAEDLRGAICFLAIINDS